MMNDDEIIEDFKRLDAANSTECDHFFERWGVGQSLIGPSRPYERFEAYRHVLELAQSADPNKYDIAHKGTAFFFCGILLFDLKYFESAIFYITAALSEDRRRTGSTSLVDYIGTPAGQILSLDENTKWRRHSAPFRSAVKAFLDEYNAENSTTHSVDEFVQKLIHPMLQDQHYSVVTSIYSYILEYQEKSKNLDLAGRNIDSMEPVLVSLFKGALIFETLLKYYYPLDNSGNRILTLGGFRNNTNFAADFPSVNLSRPTNTLQSILDDATDNTYTTTLENTARIRNTTGHKLVWDNIFSDTDNYKKLFKQEIFAILYVITKQW